MTDVGANAKMNEFCCIMGLCNLKHIGESIEDRHNKIDYYHSKIDNVPGIKYLQISDEQTCNYAYFTILVEDEYPLSRNGLYDTLKAKDIYSRKYFYPLTSDQACFKNKYKKLNLEVARDLSSKVLALPIFEGIEYSDIDRITAIIKAGEKA